MIYCPRCEKPLEGHDDGACARRMSRRFFFGVVGGGIVAAQAVVALPAASLPMCAATDCIFCEGTIARTALNPLIVRMRRLDGTVYFGRYDARSGKWMEQRVPLWSDK